MDYTAEFSTALLDSIPWAEGQVVRLFWLRFSGLSRDKFASEITRLDAEHVIIPLVLRDRLFIDPNSTMTDFARLVESQRQVIATLSVDRVERISFVVLSRDDLRIPQGSSPTVLPSWFPLMPGMETHFKISDLGQTAEVGLLSCPESRTEDVSILLLEVEQEWQSLLERLYGIKKSSVEDYLRVISGNRDLDVAKALSDYRKHLDSIADPRGYRPSAGDNGKGLLSKVLRLALRSSPKEFGALGKHSAELAGSSGVTLKPSLFSVLLRPAAPLDRETANWHAIITGTYQAYQLMNAAAHPNEFPTYPLALVSSSSVDLRRFLIEATRFLSGVAPR